MSLIQAQLTKTERVAIHEKYRMLKNHFEDHKIGRVFH